MNRELTFTPVSTASVLAAICGAATFAAFFAPALGLIGAACALSAIIALRGIAKYEFAGRRLARVGLVLSLVVPPAAARRHEALFVGESLAGHARIDYASALPAATDGGRPSISRLVGQKICLKGYALPERRLEGLREFAISPDGDDRKPDCVVLVEVDENWDWDARPIAVSGTLAELPAASRRNDGPLYRLTNAVVHPAQTRDQLVRRAPGRGC